jgi:hypothetical protein
MDGQTRTTEFSAADKDGFASEVLNELPFVRNLTTSAGNVRKWSAKNTKRHMDEAIQWRNRKAK